MVFIVSIATHELLSPQGSAITVETSSQRLALAASVPLLVCVRAPVVAEQREDVVTRFWS